MAKDNTRNDGRKSAQQLVRRAERFSLGGLLGLGRMGGWTRVLTGAIVAAVCSPALAGPEGAQVVRGNVDITRDGATTLIRASRNSIINYRSFDIGSNEAVRFIQPDSASRVLNRITTAAPTHIDGSLTSNGRVYIVNPAGVIFGNGAVLHTAGLYAAAGHLSDGDFVRGVNNFTGLQGEVVNNGSITASFVGLVGRRVANLGTIVAPKGTVIMGAGEEALVGERTGNIFVRVKGAAAAGASQAAVDNSGSIDAQGGRVIMGAGDIYAMAVRTTGAVTARDIKIEGQGHGSVVVSGRINAKDQGSGGTGGGVDVLGEKITVSSASIDASGQRGGGQVHIGGDFQGKGDRPHADTVSVSADSTINVSANQTGDGGTAIVWSDNYTQFFGTGTAHGGLGGDGGLIETSSHETVDLSPAKIDAAGGAGGKGGSWLIDPRNVNITTADSQTSTSGTNPITISPGNGGGPGTPSTINHATIETSLNAGTSVIITTAQTGRTDAGNIDIQSSISKTAGGDASLTLIAMNNITLEAGQSISSTTGKLNLSLQANQTNGGDAASGTGNVIINGSIDTNGGTFSSSGVNFTSAAAGTINTSAANTGTITLNHTGTVTIGGAMTAGGAVDITSVNSAAGTTLSANVTTLGGSVRFRDPVKLGASTVIDTTNSGGVAAGANVTFDSTINATTANTEALEINAGTGGNITVTGAVGGTTRTGLITVDNANDVTTAALTVDSFLQSAGGGTTTLGNLNSTQGISLTGAAFSFGTVTCGAPGFGLTHTGAATLGGAITVGGNLVESGGGTVALNAGITTNDTGFVSFAGAVTVGASGLTISSGTFTTAFSAGLTLGANNVTIDADEINFLGGANSVTGSGTLTLQPGADATSIGVAGGAGTLDLSASDLAALADGFSQIVIGRSTGSGAVAINAVTFNDPVVIRTPVTGGTISVDGQITGAGNASITLTGPGSTTTLNADIVTAGQAIQINDAVVLGTNILLDTTNAGGSPAGANVGITGTIEATNPGTETLTIRGGTAGDIHLSGAVGGTTALGAFTIGSAHDMTADGAIHAASITQSAGSGTGTYSGLLDAASGAINLIGAGFSITGGASTAGGNGFNLTNSAATSITTGALNLDGGFTQSGAGTVTLSANITTTGDAISFAAPVVLGTSVTLNTTNTAAAGNNIVFSGTVNGTSAGLQNLSLNAGTGGNISAGAVGGTTRLGGITITNANNVTTGALTIASLVQTTASGTTQVNGAINATGGINVSGNIFNLTSTVTTGGGFGLFVVNSGQLTLGGTLSLDGALTQSGGGAVQVNGSISTTNDAIGFTNNVTVGVSGLTFSTGSGTIAFAGSLTLAANNLTLSGDEINLNGGANSVTGTGSLTLQPGTDGVTVNVANGVDNAGQLDLTTTDLAALANGFSQITIGRSTGVQAMNISAATFSDPVLFRSSGGGTITVAGNITGAAASDASVTISGTSQVHLNANIVTDGRAIQINAPVLLGATALLDSTNSGGTAAGANIGVTGAIDATAAGTQGLTLRAGTAGDIALGAAAGGTTRLGAFTITSVHNATTGAISGTTITQSAGTGASSFGLLNTNAAGGVSLTGAVLTLAGATTTNSGTFTVNNSGLLTIGTAALTLDGAFSQTGAGAVDLNQGITTTNDAISFNGAVTAGVGVTSLNSGTAAGGVSFADTLSLGGNAFTITADAIAFNGGAGSVSGTSTLTLQPSSDATSIGIGGGAGTLQIASNTLDALADGFGQIVIGRATGTHTINFGLGGVTFLDPVLIRTPSGGSINVAGDITGSGNASVTLTGATTLAANITTDGQPIAINGAATVSGLAILDTTNAGPAGADISFSSTVNGFAAGADVLTVIAGTAGDVTFSGAVGGTTRLGILDIGEAHDVTTGAITSDEITQDDGTGITTFGGLLTARAGGINLTGNDFTLNAGASTSAGGAMAVNNAGTLSIANTAVSLDGAFDQTGAGPVTISAALTTTNDAISFAGPVTVGASVGSLNAGTATITIGSTLDLGTNNFTLTANDINFGGGAGSVTGSGVLTLQPGAAGVSIGLGGAAGTFTLSATDLAALADGFGQIVIGRADGAHAIAINAVTFSDPVLIRTPLGGSITVNGDITGTDNATLTLTGATILAANLITDGNAIQINGAVTLNASANLDSTNAGGFAGDDIGITGAVNGAAAGAQSLTLRAGAGDITLGANVGSTTRLNAFTVSNAHNVSGLGVVARSISQIAGTGASPTTAFTGLLDANTGGLSLNTNTITLTGGVTTGNNAGATLTNSGVLTISGTAWTLDGAFVQSGGGAVHLGTSITTTNDAVSFADAVTLTGTAAVNTGAGAGDITFSDTLDGTFGLTLAAGTGQLTFAGNVGAGTALGALTVSSSGGITASGSLSAASATLHSTGAVALTGAVTTPGGFTSTGTTFSNAGAIQTTNTAITVNHTGGVTINGDLAAGTGAISLSSGSSGVGDLVFGAGVDLSGSSIALGAGNGSGTAVVDALTNTPQFHGSAGGATSPMAFSFRQDAAIAGANLPGASQFGGGLGGISYTINSTNGVVSIDDATKVDDTALSLSGTGAGATGIAVTVDLGLRSFHALTGATVGGNVTTNAGDVTFDAAARTLNAITFDAGSGQIHFGSTVAADGTSLTLTAADLQLGGVVTPGAGGDLLIQTSDPAQDIFLGGTGSEGSGDMHLQAAEIADLAAGFGTVTIGRSNSTGTIHVNSLVTFQNNTALRAPTTVLASSIITNGVAISISDDVTVAANVAIDTTNSGAAAGGASIGIGGAIDADAAGNDRTLALRGGTGGSVSIGDDVGASQRLSTLTITAASMSLEAVNTLRSQSYVGAATLHGDMDVSTAGSITILGPVTLASNVTLTTPGLLANDNITVEDVNSDGTARALVINAGASGHVTAGVLGGSAALANLTVTGLGSSIHAVTTTGFQTYNGPVTIFGDLQGTSIAVNSSLILNGDVSINGTTSTTFGGTIRSALNQHHNLAINSPTTVITGSVGDLAGYELGTLTTESGGLLNIHSTVINTTGAQTYGDAVTIFSDSTFTSTGGGIAFGSTLNSDTTARALTLNTGGGGDTVFGAEVGGISAFTSLTTNADGATRVGGNVTTVGAQNYGDAVVLTANAVFSGVGLTFGSTINSDGTARSLRLNGQTGDVTVAGLIGGVSPVSSLTVSGNAVTLAGATSIGAQAVTGEFTLSGEMTSTTAGSIDVSGALTLAGDSSFSTAGGASDHVTITGAIDSPTAHTLAINAGAGNVSLISNVGLGGALASLSVTGSNIVAHAVTTSGSQTYNGALTIDSNLSSSVLGSIGINGALKLDADVVVATANGSVTFNGTVNSGLVNHALTVNTGGGGATRFVGAVGNVSSLTTLTTNADGTTRIEGGTVQTSGDQTFGDNLVLGADTTLSGKNIIFQGAIDSDTSATPRALTVNSTSTGDTRFQGNVGGNARLLSITTNADGTTRIGASLATTNGMTFADAVKLTGNTTLDGGSGSLFFQKAIDADSSATDPLLTLLSDAAADADTTPFKFAANIGATKRLGGLTLGADRSPPLAATAVFSDAFDANGRIQASGVAGTEIFTITTGNGGFTMGRGQKFTTFGSFTLLTTGNATLSDLTALTNIKVTASNIIIKLRPGGPVLDHVFETPTDQRANDPGVDFVASGTIDFSRAPTVVGSGAQPTFSTDTGFADPQLIRFGFRQFTDGVRAALFTDPRSGHTGELLPLDLKGEGPSVTSIASSIAGAIPRDTETREVATPVTVGKALRAPLQEMGVATKDLTIDDMVEFMVGRSMYRDLPLKARPMIASGDYRVTVNRLSMATVEAAVESYRQLVFTQAVDDKGNPMLGEDGKVVMVNRTDLIRDTIAEAWDNYSNQAQDADGPGFRAYLESHESSGSKAEKDALAYLKGAQEVLDKLDALGLSPFETSIPKNKLVGEIRPQAMTVDQLKAAISGPKVSMR